MRHEADFERRLADWIEMGPYEAPDRTIEHAIAFAGTHRQRRLTRSAVWRSAMDRLHLTPVVAPSARNGWLMAAALVAVVVLLTAAVVGSGTLRLGGTEERVPAVGGPQATVTATPAPTPVAVTGSETCTQTASVTTTTVGDVTDYRGGAFACVDSMSDPRVSGQSSVQYSIDEYADQSADVWGTLSLRNDGGTWEGRWTGTIDKGYTTHRVDALVTGTGDYAGLVYRFRLVSEDGAAHSTLTGRIEAAGTPITGQQTCTMTDGGLYPVNAGDVGAYRGMVESCTDAMSDPRASGTGTNSVSIDERADKSADLWGTYVLKNADGSWEGRWSGTIDPGYTTHRIDAILTGAGAYAGLEYRLHVEGTGNPTYTLSGTIVPAL